MYKWGIGVWLMDILIARIQYPNDPTRKKNVHQHFVSEVTSEYMILHSVSSILGKEKRVFKPWGHICPYNRRSGD